VTGRWGVVLVLVLAACGSGGKGHPSGDAASGDGATDGSGTTDGSVALVLPPANAKADYQLGGAYTPPTGVTVVSRDRNASPAAGIYNICYVNGFQIQPDEAATWQAQYPDLILRDTGGNPVVDTQWNEMLIDVSTPTKRTAVAAIVDGWIDGCASAGFAAVEIDNLDSYTRSQGLLTADNAVVAMRLFADHAHTRGLPAAQKNSSDLVVRKTELGTDFAVAEQCNEFSECNVYTAGYGDHVIVIEYMQAAFNTGCSAYPQLSIILRDLNLVTPSDAGYVYEGC
jgi:hypothetical protein